MCQTRFVAKYVILVGLVIFMGCSTSPLGRSQFTMMPKDQIDRMGIQAFENQKKNLRVSNDQAANRLIRCVSNTLTKQVKGRWEIVVFKEASPNAFALPGGKIGVHTGLLKVARNQHQLATVIGHEIAHVLAQHSNERVSQQFAVQSGLSLTQALAGATTGTGQALMGLLGVGAQYGILMPYGRSQESEADLLGLDLMANAGFDPKESIDLWINMGKASRGQTPEFLSTHPSHGTRIEDLKKRMPSALRKWNRALVQGKRPQCR